MPDSRASPFGTEDPYPAYHAARTQAPVQWNEALGAHLVLSYDHERTFCAVPSGALTRATARDARLAGRRGPGVWTVEPLAFDERPPGPHAAAGRCESLFHASSGAGIRGRVTAIVDSAFTALAEGEPVELMSGSPTRSRSR